MIVRAPTWDDLGEVARLVAVCDETDIGRVDMTLDELRRDWRSPGSELERDAWLVELGDQLVGYGWLWGRESPQPKSFGFVHPDVRGKGVGSELLRRIESRARELGAGMIAHYAVGEPAAELLEGQGYRAASRFYRMALDLDAPPVVHALPAGIGVRAFEPGRDDRPLHAALTEAFADEPDFEAESFERWRERRVADPSFDPELWLLANDGDSIAGFALASLSTEGGFLDALGVRSPWRRRGLGLALLTRTFADAYGRGARRVALGVAADNPTGAPRLYERAGMSVAFVVDRYEKTLR